LSIDIYIHIDLWNTLDLIIRYQMYRTRSCSIPGTTKNYRGNQCT